jgi:hypothetical protein
MQEIKATAVLPTMEFVMFEHGKDVYRDILDRLTPDQQNVFRKRMLPGSWVLLADFIAFNTAILDVLFDGDQTKAEQLGYLSADKGFGTFYKLFLKLGNPNIIASKATSIFESIHRPGKQTLVKNEKGEVVFEISGFMEIYPLLFWRIKGYYQRVCELTGAANVQVFMENVNGDFSLVRYRLVF